MKKYHYIWAVLLGLSLAVPAFAQLPSNPWEAQKPEPNSGYFKTVPKANPQKAPAAPMYNQGPTSGEILPVDPWATARDRSGIATWRGSGQHGKLNYIGEATTWSDTDGGQQLLAPEANRHNTIVMMEHLRKMGYKIPENYDNGVMNMPKNYATKLRASYEDLQRGHDPMSVVTNNLLDIFEKGTGLDYENLMFNSLDIIGTD